jgi:hypothetical protein
MDSTSAGKGIPQHHVQWFSPNARAQMDRIDLFDDGGPVFDLGGNNINKVIL